MDDNASDCMVGFIIIDPDEPSILHSLDDVKSFDSSSSRDVNMVDVEIEDRGADDRTPRGATEEGKFIQSRDAAPPRTEPIYTPTDHFIVINNLLRQPPFDPVTLLEADAWLKRMESTITNLNFAFATTTAAPP